MTRSLEPGPHFKTGSNSTLAPTPIILKASATQGPFSQNSTFVKFSLSSSPGPGEIVTSPSRNVRETAEPVILMIDSSLNGKGPHDAGFFSGEA